MMNNTPSGTKKHHMSIEPESRQMAKMFFFFFFFFFFFRWASSNFMNLSRWFSHKTAAFPTEQCTSPSLFSRFEVSQGSLNCSLENYGLPCNAIFFFTCMHVHKSLSNKM